MRWIHFAVLVALGVILLAPIFFQSRLPPPFNDPQVLGAYQAAIFGLVGVTTYLIDKPRKPNLKYNGYHFDDEPRHLQFNVTGGDTFVKGVQFLSVRVHNSEKLPAIEPTIGLRLVDPESSPTAESPIRMSNFALGPILLSPIAAEENLADIGTEAKEMRLAQTIREKAFVPIEQAYGKVTTPFIVGFAIEGGRYFWFVTKQPAAPQIPRALPSALGVRIEAHIKEIGAQFLTKKLLMLELRTVDEVVIKRQQDIFD